MTGSVLFVFLLAGVQAVSLAAQETLSVASEAAGNGGHAAGASAADARLDAVREGLLRRAGAHLAEENPWQALRDYRRVGESSAAPSQDVDLQFGLARTFLMLGHADIAMDHYRAAAKLQQGALDPGLQVRILLRAARFKKALAVSSEAVRRARNPSAELLAAHASAHFRVQRTGEAANFYRRVLLKDPLHAEAHLRLGSGLLNPRQVKLGDELLRGSQLWI